MSYASHNIRHGQYFEPECSRTTHRLSTTRNLLLSLGFEENTNEHLSDCKRHPEHLRRVVYSYRGSVICTCGQVRNPVTWSPDLTDEVIDAAYHLADLAIQAKAAPHHRAIAAMRTAEAAARRSIA